MNPPGDHPTRRDKVHKSGEHRVSTPHPSRRQFLQFSGRALALSLVGLGPHAAAPTASVYSGPIIDTHTHFYDPTRAEGVAWPPADDKLLYRRVLPADYKALPKPTPVKGTVVVEASSWLEDNQWILNLAARDPFIVGFVGHLEVGRPDFAKNLTRFAANPIFRGLRIGADRVRVALKEADVLADLQLLASRSLALDLLGGPEMLPDVQRLAEKIPQLRMIIDHVANVPIGGKSADPRWAEGMRAAGRHPNVFCKVSGLVEGTGRTDGHAPTNVDFYRPVLDVIWEAFGEDRLVYGSNWPVSERFAPCAVVQQIVTDYFVPKGYAIAEKVFFKNSQALYRWPR